MGHGDFKVFWTKIDWDIRRNSPYSPLRHFALLLLTIHKTRVHNQFSLLCDSRQSSQMQAITKQSAVRCLLLHCGVGKRPPNERTTIRWLLSKAAIYLHVGPAGDCWTGDSIFAAKHLQPDYVKSIQLPPDVSTSYLLEILEDDTSLSQRIFDEEVIPEWVLEQARLQSADDANKRV